MAFALAETVVIKDGNVFAVSSRDGSLPLRGPHPLGVYLDDCRFLSGHELWVGGSRPALAAVAAESGAGSAHELALPGLQIRLERQVLDTGEVEETVRVRAGEGAPPPPEIELRLAADFEPMLAIRGIVDAGPGVAVDVTPTPRGVRLAARGRDGRHRATTVTADRACAPGDRSGWLRFGLALGSGGTETITLRYELHEGDAPPGRRARRATRRGRPPAPWTTITTDDARFDRVLGRSLLDLRMLRSRLGRHEYLAAGVPWYATLFGRDALIAASQALAFDPPLAAQTLGALAGRIGTRDDPEHDEEPGKVLHELRVGEVARRGLSPLARYYGTVDATPLFLCLLCDHADWSGDLSLFRALRSKVDAMLGWIDGPGDRDGDGLLDYGQRAPAGLRNHGWKDSDDGVLDATGAPLEPPIALIEPQGYALLAKRRLARLFALDGDEARARALLREAGALAERLERFWLPARGCYSMGFGADGRPSEALASNQGHLLWASALPPDRARAVRDALMSEAMFSGWGVRTLAAGETGYDPLGYHLGTVWPHDTAMIAVGLRRHGFDADFARIFAALLDAASMSEASRLPELFAGHPRSGPEPPAPYPVACRPQAWAAGAIPALATAGLGLAPDGLARRLRVVRPTLPPGVGRLEVRGLRIAGARLDLRFERSGGQVALADATAHGDLAIVAGH